MILKLFSEVEPYIQTVQQRADNNRKSLGFFPKSAYVNQANQGKLWVKICLKSKKYLGHLLFGGRFPALKITQILVDSDAQETGVGRELIKELVDYGESNNYLAISARVAADLSANSFWEKMGFDLITQEPGGKTKNRIINIRRRDLATPSLLNIQPQIMPKDIRSKEALRYINRPILSNPSYVLDLNIFFDITKQREKSEETSLLMQAAFNNHIRLCTTKEFIKELQRHSTTGDDPILQFAKTLPALPDIPYENLKPLISELRTILFPHRALDGKSSERDKSDLIHVASCIHHKVFGFITRELAILRGGEIIRQTYGLDIVSPTDLIQSIDSNTSDTCELRLDFKDKELQISDSKEAEREAVEKFLIKLGVDFSDIKVAWDPGTSGCERQRVCIKADQELISVASWNTANISTKNINLQIFINESYPEAEKIVDYILETVSRESTLHPMRKINLSIRPQQIYTKQTALERGFCGRSDSDGNSLPGLTKISYKGVITPSNWLKFVDDYKNLTGLTLPDRMPTYKEFINTGIHVKGTTPFLSTYLKLFDFETLLSPALFLCPNRNGIIIPIRTHYANNLLTDTCIHPELFPSKEALLHVEKTYFRNPLNTKMFHKGLPVVFYVSGAGGGSKEAVGSGRITFNDILSVEEIEINLHRQGVLSERELKKIASPKGKIHVFTFDNFNVFTRRLSFNELKNMGCISPTNLVTAEPLSYKNLTALYEAAFAKE